MSIFFALLVSLLSAGSVQAGVFNLTQYIEQDQWAVGIEPELQLSGGSGLGGMAKATYGLNPLSNVQLGVGSGSGDRTFRASSALTFDFVPDLATQPGIGVAVQTAYINRRIGAGRTEITAFPYIHKSFETAQQGRIDPFIAVPFGFGFSDGRYDTIASLNIGTNIIANVNLSYTVELGINLRGQETSLSGGFTYFH
jgi:hypothetical protein